MSRPALREDGRAAVVTLYEAHRERQRVNTIEDAVELVSTTRRDDVICEKIVTSDDEVVYDSTQNGDVEDWASEWRLQLRRLSASDRTYACPYGNRGCLTDDRCLECRLDERTEALGASRAD